MKIGSNRSIGQMKTPNTNVWYWGFGILLLDQDLPSM